MSLGELQRAALEPYRFKSRLSKSTIRGTDSFSDRTAIVTTGHHSQCVGPSSICSQLLYTEWSDGVGAAFLIPGGRYVIILARYGAIDLYDLGLPASVRTSSTPWSFGTSAPPNQPIARAVLPEGVGEVSYDCSRLQVIPLGDDGTKVRVAVDCAWSLFMADEQDVM